MQSKKWLLLTGVATGLAAVLAIAKPATADAIIYQNLPTSLATPPNISFHNAIGPVIADDFVPIAGGTVTTVTWWGSAPTSNDWEIVLQNNNPAVGEPALTPPGNNVTGGVKALPVVAVGVPFAPLPGVFQFTADISSLVNFAVNPGTDYWITIANFEPGWNWALALGGPTIGTENFNAHMSTGGICLDGGPHCGPWTDIHTDFAVQISAVPEPGTIAFIGFGLAAFGLARRRRRTQTA